MYQNAWLYITLEWMLLYDPCNQIFSFFRETVRVLQTLNNLRTNRMRNCKWAWCNYDSGKNIACNSNACDQWLHPIYQFMPKSDIVRVMNIVTYNEQIFYMIPPSSLRSKSLTPIVLLSCVELNPIALWKYDTLTRYMHQNLLFVYLFVIEPIWINIIYEIITMGFTMWC